MTISEMRPAVLADEYRRLCSDDRERPRAAHGAPVDLEAAELAVADLLVALGQDLDTEDFRDTPRRVATALAELLTPRPFSMTTFANDEEYDELVVVRDIAFHSLCAHHLLPFIGVARVRAGGEDRRSLQAGPCRRALCPATAGAGASDPPGRRCPRRATRASWSRCDVGSDASLHVASRRVRNRCAHPDNGGQGSGPGRSGDPLGVLDVGRHGMTQVLEPDADQRQTLDVMARQLSDH